MTVSLTLQIRKLPVHAEYLTKIPVKKTKDKLILLLIDITCLTELFPIYQNKHWTIRRRDNCSGASNIDDCQISILFAKFFRPYDNSRPYAYYF